MELVTYIAEILKVNPEQSYTPVPVPVKSRNYDIPNQRRNNR